MSAIIEHHDILDVWVTPRQLIELKYLPWPKTVPALDYLLIKYPEVRDTCCRKLGARTLLVNPRRLQSWIEETHLR